MSHERKPITVENQRTHQTINLFGRILAPKGKGRTSCCDLTGEELGGPACQGHLTAGRLKVIRDVRQAPAHVEPPSVDVPTDGPAITVVSWDLSSLKDLSASEQKDICKELGLKTSGREDQRVQRILDSLRTKEDVLPKAGDA